MADKLSSRYSTWLIVSSGVTLFMFIPGLGKAWRASESACVLDVADPIFRVPFRQLMVGVGLLELFIAFFRLFTSEKELGLLAIAWLGTSFGGYSFLCGVTGFGCRDLWCCRQLEHLKIKKSLLTFFFVSR